MELREITKCGAFTRTEPFALSLLPLSLPRLHPTPVQLEGVEVVSEGAGEQDRILKHQVIKNIQDRAGLAIGVQDVRWPSGSDLWDDGQPAPEPV